MELVLDIHGVQPSTVTSAKSKLRAAIAERAQREFADAPQCSC